MSIESNDDLEALKRVGLLVRRALDAMSAAAAPGVTTRELDEVGASLMRRQRARSAPQLAYRFPGFSCISVNDEIVHGVPGLRRLREGDVLKIDVTAELDGYVADAALTHVVGHGTEVARRLRDCARLAFERAMSAARAGLPVSGIGRVVDAEVRRRGFRVVRELCGHGVGRTVHEHPSVPNYFDPLQKDRLTEGLVIAVEPIIATSAVRPVTSDDGWTIRTHNGALAAHYEHTLVVTGSEPILLTA